MLTFAQGKAITTEAAADWLAIHGANVYGIKGTLRERVQWVQEHQAMILARDYSGAEEPWQFLAFCHEWADYKHEGFGYVSSLPVGMDATCSVYQHIAALLRDPDIGRLVNLTPAEVSAGRVPRRGRGSRRRAEGRQAAGHDDALRLVAANVA